MSGSTIRRALVAAFVLLVLVLPITLPLYQVTLLNYVGLGSLVALGLVLLTGVGGLISFGQAAFTGMGAYTTGYLTAVLGLSPWLGLLAGLAVCAASALLLGFVTLSLRGHYLALSTIAWSLSLFFLVGTVGAFGGRDGLTGVPGISVFGIDLADPRRFAYLIWAAVIIGLVSVGNLLASRPGRAIRSLRGRTVLAESFGVDTVAMRRAIFIHAALLAGVSGWLFAHYVRFVGPSPFGVNASIDALFMAVLGGATSIWGAVVGAAAIVVLRDRLEDLAVSLLGVTGALEIIVFGTLMVLLLQRARIGIVPFLDRFIPPAAPPLIARDAAPLPRRTYGAGNAPLLTLHEVSKRFGGLVAVGGVTFSLDRGQILGVIGPNGAGKSTLFNLVTGVLRPDGGRIDFLGRQIEALSSRQIAALGMARTFQHVQLRGTMSVLENVALGAHLRGRQGIVAAILRLDRRQEASLLAEAARQVERVGLGAVLHAPAGSLALGQQRIVEIARALAADPALLLLDEPAAGLRFAEKQALGAVLRQLRTEGVGILIVEHDMDFVMNLVDRLVVMDFGTRIAAGEPTEVQADPKVREAYLGAGA